MKDIKINILLILLIIIFAFSITDKVIDNNVLISIKSGQDLIENGITNLDKHCYIEELEYINPNWAFDMILGYVYNTFGFVGIYTISIILISVISILLFYTLKEIGANRLIAFIITLVVLSFLNKDVSIDSTFLTSEKLLSYIIFILEIFLLEKFTNNNEKKYVIFMLVSSIVLVNTNLIAWPCYLILYVPYLIECVILKIFENKNKVVDLNKIEILSRKNNNILVWIGVFLIIMLTGFINPNGKLIFTYLFKLITSDSIQYISEYGALIVGNSLAFVTIIIFTIAIFVFTKVKLRIVDCIMIFELILLTLWHQKNLPILIVISFIIITRNIIRFVDLYSDSKDEIDKISTNKIVLTIITIIVLFISIYNFYLNKNKNCISENNPIKIVEYINDNLKDEEIKLYNNIWVSGYLIFSDIKVFVDTRYTLYFNEFNETEIFEDYVRCVAGKENYKSVFEKYDINYILLNKDEIINSYIQKDDNYLNIFEEEKYVLYKKIRGN